MTEEELRKKYPSIAKVTERTIPRWVDVYRKDREGIENTDTTSEAMFFFVAVYEGGAQILTHGHGIKWVGLQNATACFTEDGMGGSFPTICDALERVFKCDWVRNFVYYSTNSVERLRFIADMVEQNYDRGTFVLIPKDEHDD
jgi:hypothetical protein